MDLLGPGPMTAAPRRSGPCAGFTLLEAAVALVIVGLGVGGAVAAASQALRTQAELSRHAEALALAESRLLRIEALPRDSLPGRGVRSRTSRVWLADRAYARSTELRPDGDGSRWRASVDVAWEGGSVRLATVLYRPRPTPFAGRRR